MERIRAVLKKICVLPPLRTIFIAVPTFALVGYVLENGIDGPLAYLSYIASAYGLVVVLTGVFRMVHPIQHGVKNHPLGGRLMEDTIFRAEISLYVGFTVNLLYIVMKMVSGIYYRSLWFISLAVYYALLAVMRFSLLYRRRKLDRMTELRRYRLCGAVLLLMNLALAGIVCFMVWQNRGYEYPGTLIYAMAAYSFYAVITAIINVVKFRKHGSPILSAAKAVNLVAAMVSILSLETAMLAQFGSNDDPALRKTMTGATGGCICVIVLGMAVYMIVKSTKSIRQLRSYRR